MIAARPVDPPPACRVGRKIHDRKALPGRCAVIELCASPGARTGYRRSYSEGVRCPTGPVQSDPPGLNPRRPPSLPPGGGRPLTSRFAPLGAGGLPSAYLSRFRFPGPDHRFFGAGNLRTRVFPAFSAARASRAGAILSQPTDGTGARAVRGTAVVHNTPVVHSRPSAPLRPRAPHRDGGTRATHGPHRRRGRNA